MSNPLGIATVPYQQISIESNQANELVPDQIKNIAGAAEDMLDTAQAAIAGIKRVQDVSLSDVAFNATGDFSQPPSAGELSGTVEAVSIPAFTGTAETIGAVSLEGKQPREFTDGAPTIETTERPVKNVSEKPTFNTELAEPELPEKPAIDPQVLIDKINEVLGKYNFPELTPPEVSVPAFQNKGTDGVEIPSVKDVPFNWSEQLQDTDVTVSLVNSLVKSLTEHGFGLSSGTENAIYLRHKSRIEAEYDETYHKADARMAAMGWGIPSGPHQAGLAELEEKKNRALLDASREVMAKNADLTFQDRQEARKVAVQFEGVYRQYLAGYYQRSLEATKTLADNIIRVYGLQVETAKIQLQKYVTEIQLYEAEIRSAMLQLEVYSKNIEAQKVTAELRGQDLQGVLSYIQAYDSLLRLYEGEIRGALAVLEVNKGQISIFDTQIKAWMGEIQAYTSELDAWGKETEVNGLTVQNYLALAQAYSAEVDGVRAYNEVQKSKAQIEVEKAKINLEDFKGQIEAYKASVQGAIANVEGQSTALTANARAYSAKEGAKAAIADAQARIEGIKADTDTKRLALALEQNKANMENTMRETMVDVDILKSIGQQFSQLAASLYSAINVGASISDSFGRSVSDSNSYGASVSNSASYTYSDKSSS